MKNFQKQKKIQLIYLDWKEFSDEALKAFTKSLKKLGIFVYIDPTTEGSDTYGIVLSKSKITNQQLKDFCAYNIGYKSWKDFTKENEL